MERNMVTAGDPRSATWGSALDRPVDAFFQRADLLDWINVGAVREAAGCSKPTLSAAVGAGKLGQVLHLPPNWKFVRRSEAEKWVTAWRAKHGGKRTRNNGG